MKFDRLFVVLSLVLSSAALFIALKGPDRDPLGSDISNYDLSSPEKTLTSINSMVAKQDLRAGWQLLKVVLQSDATPETKLFFSDEVKLTVLKSMEVTGSAYAKNNGIIVSFVKFTVSGVDYHTVQYFRKDPSNRFRLADAFYVPYGTDKNEQDKTLESAIEEFKKTGKV